MAQICSGRRQTAAACTCFKTTTYLYVSSAFENYVTFTSSIYFTAKNVEFESSVTGEHPSCTRKQHQLSLAKFRLCINLQITRDPGRPLSEFLWRVCAEVVWFIWRVECFVACDGGLK